MRELNKQAEELIDFGFLLLFQRLLRETVQESLNENADLREKGVTIRL